jgi:glycine cleavage system H protein
VDIPQDRRYTKDHEWARLEGGSVRVGITDYAQDALGDVVFVQVPTTGTVLAAGSSMSEVESTKSVSDIYAPVDGTITDVNDELVENPQRLNEDPYGDGWICVLALADPTQFEGLLDAEAYRALVEG